MQTPHENLIQRCVAALRGQISTQLRRNMASGVASMGINFVILGIGIPIYIGFLGVDGYGLWLTLAMFVNIARIADFGIGSAITKFVAEECGRGDQVAIRSYIASGNLILLSTGAAMIVAATLFAKQYPRLFDLNIADGKLVAALFPYTAALAAYQLIVQCSQGAVAGLGRTDLSNGAVVLSRLMELLVAVSLLFCGFGLTALLIGQATSLMFGHAYCSLLVRRMLDKQPLRAWLPRREPLFRLMQFGGALATQPVIWLLLQPLNRVIICRFCGTSGLAVYEIAYRSSFQLRRIVDVGVRAIMPEISRRVGLANGSIEDSCQLTRKTKRFVFRIALPAYAFVSGLLLACMPQWLGPKVGGEVFPVFAIMALGLGFNIAAIPEYYALFGWEKGAAIVRIFLWYAAVNVACLCGYLYFLNEVAPIGFAVVVLISSVASMLAVRREYRRATAEHSDQGNEAFRIDGAGVKQIESSKPVTEAA